jgi:hypothetical protein
MGTLITRSAIKHSAFALSDEARQRATEYLKSVGYTEEQLKPIEWPDDAISAYRDWPGAPWQFTTKADILRAKREHMELNLRQKRQSDIVEKRALYVWVFYCPGISGFFEGWWSYLVGLNHDYHGGGFKGNLAGRLLDQVRDLFPLVEKDLFGNFNLELWMRRFIDKYPRGLWCGKPQGKAPVWALVHNGSVEKIISRAQWPGENQN